VSGYRGVRAAILGASGFIGRWVARKLCEGGAKPYLLVRDPACARAVFEQYRIHGEVIEADFLDTAALGELYRRIRPSITFNLAGYGVDRSEREEGLAYRINAELPRAICEAAAAVSDVPWPGQHVIHAGSAAEYGLADGALPEDGPALPSTLYGKSKLQGSLAVTESCGALGLRGITARLFTVYGPGEHTGRLLPSLIEASLSGNSLDLTEGLPRRDFTYVEDVAEGLLRLGLVTGNGEPVVNLATGRLTEVREFVKTAAGILGIPLANLRFGAIPTRPGEMVHEPVTIDRLQRLLAWMPPVTIAEGVRKTLEISLLGRTERI
jgi:nucleoside-diphosphate-sugar epimerase